MSATVVIIVTACLVAIAGSLLGTFLVLRKQSMISDAISHAVLPGIVGAYWLSGDTATIPALIGAALMGLLTVVSVELLTRSGRVKSDAAIGVVFPLLFSLGVIWVSMSFRNVHLDMDAVLYGEIAYAPLNKMLFFGQQVPESLVLMGFLTLINAVFVGFFYKELKISTFDVGLSAALGFIPAVIHYTLMILLSLTTVGAFQSVGAILIVAFVIIPPAAAYLLTRKLNQMLMLSLGIGIFSSISGYYLSLWLDANIAGTIATVLGTVFIGCLIFSPLEGVLPTMARRRRQHKEFRAKLLLSALRDDQPALTLSDLGQRLEWEPKKVHIALRYARQLGFVEQRGDLVQKTQKVQRMQKATPISGD